MLAAVTTAWKANWVTKGGFFQKVRFIFQISKEKYSKKLSWTWNLNFPPITVNNKFIFQAQDSNLEYFFLEIWKMIRTFWKKSPLDSAFFFYITSNLSEAVGKKNRGIFLSDKWETFIDLPSWNSSVLWRDWHESTHSKSPKWKWISH